MFFKKRNKITEEPPPRVIPEIKGALPHEPDYPDGKFPQNRTVPRVVPPLHEMPPKPPGANRKK